MVAVGACMGGTRGSGVLSSTGNVLEMSVVSDVGGVCDMCMYLARAVCVERGGGEWMRGLGFGFTNHLGTGGVWDACLRFDCGSVDGVCGEWVGGRGLGPG